MQIYEFNQNVLFYLYLSVNFTICIYFHPLKKYRHLKCQNNLENLKKTLKKTAYISLTVGLIRN